MYTIFTTHKFDKLYSKLIGKDKKLINVIDKVLEKLTQDPFYPGLKSHIVDYDKDVGSIWSSRVTGDMRILWALDPNNKLVIILLKIGGHDFVY